MIRRDLIGVQEFNALDCGGWCYIGMFRERPAATRAARDVRQNRTLGMIRDARLVHPPQSHVDAWTAAGNRIS